MISQTYHCAHKTQPAVQGTVPTEDRKVLQDVTIYPKRVTQEVKESEHWLWVKLSRP